MNFKLRLCVTLALGLVSTGQAHPPVVVPGFANPWLAGMPAGTSSCVPSSGLCDVVGGSPDCSAIEVVDVSLAPGTALIIQASGDVCNMSGGCAPVGPDGEAFIEEHVLGAENGMSGLRAPLRALVGVFLGPDQPDLTPPPADMDFTSPLKQARAFQTPALKQVFFIGDGRTDTGELQRVVVPDGATRLFLGTMDGAGWYNNTGSYTVTVGQDCYANCDGSTASPTLNANDFLCFLIKFAMGCP